MKLEQLHQDLLHKDWIDRVDGKLIRLEQPFSFAPDAKFGDEKEE